MGMDQVHMNNSATCSMPVCCVSLCMFVNVHMCVCVYCRLAAAAAEVVRDSTGRQPAGFGHLRLSPAQLLMVTIESCI